MKLVKLFAVLVMVLAVSAIAYAETQSVKVSGDITERAIARSNYDLSALDKTAWNMCDFDTHLMSQAEIQVNADLTDNVGAVVRLANERVWGNTRYNATSDLELIGSGATTTNDQFGVGVDLAYVELREFLYSPLTLKIGRQDLWFGKGFIVGKSYTGSTNNIFAPEYTVYNAFDAIRATLDYDPWTIDGVFAKIAENGRRVEDDINLWGLNVGYVFGEYNAEMEGYWFFKNDRANVVNGATTGATKNISNDVHTLGLRGSVDPIEDWTVALEGAYQAGNYSALVANANQLDARDRSAFAIDASLEIRTFQDNFAWKPVMGLEYIYYSGQKNSLDQGLNATGDFNGWDRMYRGKEDTNIREFSGVFYRTQDTFDTAGDTNQHQVLVSGSIEPTDSLTCTAKYGHFWLAEENSAARTGTNLGDEVDLSTKWDYTEDVSFGILSSWFFPGSHYNNDKDQIATDIVGSVALSF